MQTWHVGPARDSEARLQNSARLRRRPLQRREGSRQDAWIVRHYAVRDQPPASESGPYTGKANRGCQEAEKM
jgi:hypothetical protein